MQSKVNEFNTAWMCGYASTIDMIKDLSGTETKADYYRETTVFYICSEHQAFLKVFCVKPIKGI